MIISEVTRPTVMFRVRKILASPLEPRGEPSLLHRVVAKMKRRTAGEGSACGSAVYSSVPGTRRSVQALSKIGKLTRPSLKYELYNSFISYNGDTSICTMSSITGKSVL